MTTTYEFKKVPHTNCVDVYCEWQALHAGMVVVFRVDTKTGLYFKRFYDELTLSEKQKCISKEAFKKAMDLGKSVD